MDAWIEGTEACVGNLEIKREKWEAVAALPEVPDEETEQETVGELAYRYGDGNLP
jgi:hypothetical protein